MPRTTSGYSFQINISGVLNYFCGQWNYTSARFNMNGTIWDNSFDSNSAAILFSQNSFFSIWWTSHLASMHLLGEIYIFYFLLTDGVGKHALRMASELECRGAYLGSWRIGCILKGCLLFIDIMIAEVSDGRCPSSSFGSVLVRLQRNDSGVKRKNTR